MAALRDGAASGPVRFQSNWGGANRTGAVGWLAEWIWKHTPDHRSRLVDTGRSTGDNLQALADGNVDIAATAPAWAALSAQLGWRPFQTGRIPRFRSIAATRSNQGSNRSGCSSSIRHIIN
jgi:hypothetical protein